MSQHELLDQSILPKAKGPVIRATFFFNLSCNIVAVQVETLCCAYYHLRGQLVSQQNTTLQVEATGCEKQTRGLLSATNFSFVARITTEASTCLATNLTSTLVIGCQRSSATRQIKKKTWRTQRTQKTSFLFFWISGDTFFHKKQNCSLVMRKNSLYATTSPTSSSLIN